MKHLLLPLAAVVVLASSCKNNGSGEKAKITQDTVFTIKGDIKGLDSGYVYFFNYQTPESASDSAKVTNGRFTFTGKVDTPTVYLLGIRNFGLMEYRTVFFAENTTITISGRKDIPNDLKTTGGPVQEEHNLFLSGQNVIDEKQRRSSKSHDSLFIVKNFKGADSVAKILEGLEGEKRAHVRDFARKHPSSLAAAFEVYQAYPFEPDPTELAPVYNNLDENVRRSYFGRKIAELLDIVKKTSPGNPAPEFSQADLNGKEVSLSSYRQQYVLIDFWAAWCVPCRDEHQKMIPLYKKFHPKGFDILGVSIDQNKHFLQSTILYEKLPWNLVTDLKGWKNSVAQLYGIKNIPMNFLVDKEGIIIAKGLKVEELEKKLEEIFK